VKLQRQDQIAANMRLRMELPAHGLEFKHAGSRAVQENTRDVYAMWKEKLGSRGWTRLEQSVGKIET
jgi:hypothetical protein